MSDVEMSDEERAPEAERREWGALAVVVVGCALLAGTVHPALTPALLALCLGLASGRVEGPFALVMQVAALKLFVVAGALVTLERLLQ